MSTGACSGAGITRMATKFNVNGLPQLVCHGRLIAAGSLDFEVKQKQVHCINRDFDRSNKTKRVDLTCEKVSINQTTKKRDLHCLKPRLGSRPMGVPLPAMNLCNFCRKICSALERSPVGTCCWCSIGELRRILNGESLLAY